LGWGDGVKGGRQKHVKDLHAQGRGGERGIPTEPGKGAAVVGPEIFWAMGPRGKGCRKKETPRNHEMKPTKQKGAPV